MDIGNLKQVNGTTFQAPELGDVKPTVVIGGKPADKFIPNVNISFHDDEFFINLNRKDKLAVSKCETPVELPGEDTDIWHIDDSGRLKWDIEFSSKPAVNTWSWELKYSKGIEFFYQGELTAEEIENGAIRPDEVVGSYAVYCNKKNNTYKTGKLCHIYRPYCYDATGNHVYADLNISGNSLTITIPRDYLDNAVYPVRLDPTIGYTSIGAGVWTRASAIVVESLAVSAPSSSGTASKVYIYLSSGYNTSIQLGYYAESTLASSGSISSPAGGAWNSVDVSGSISSGGSYHPAFSLQSSGTGGGGIAYDSMTDGMQYENNISSLPATWTSTVKYTRKFSLYLEYIESSGSSSTIPVIIQAMNQFNGGLT